MLIAAATISSTRLVEELGDIFSIPRRLPKA
jgi:hypothetical protein